MTTATEILKQIKDNDVKFVDLRFTDPKRQDAARDHGRVLRR
jgi:glutamine synthetase